MLVIEGYVALFCVEDLTGDVVRAGLLRGRWRAAAGVEAAELGGRADGGALDHDAGRRARVVRARTCDRRYGAWQAARKLIGHGTMSGLSIDIIARDRSPRVARGRELREIEVPEASLVTSPMLPGGPRFAAAGSDWEKCAPRARRG